jgi:hypothetical protein
VNPVIALGLAWAVGDGELSPRTGVAAALVVTAVVFTRESKGKGREDAGETVLDRGGLAAALFSGYLRRARTPLSS